MLTYKLEFLQICGYFKLVSIYKGIYENYLTSKFINAVFEFWIESLTTFMS